MEITLKRMGKEHIPQIAEIEKECFSDPWSEAAISEELENENSYFLVAVTDDVVGYIGVQEICGEAYITNVAVTSDNRKSGVGRKLLRAACEGAKSRKCEFITLEVRESNYPAISLYESEGFERAGVRKNFYSAPAENGIIYTKYFNTEV